LQAAWQSPTVRAVLLVTVAMNTLFFPYQHMLPVFARDVLALGPAGLGALVAAGGGGALLGALAIATCRGDVGHRTLFGAAVLVAPTLLVAFSGSRWLPLCVILLVAMGVAESAFATMQSTLVLLEAPERVRGGAMGILSACIGHAARRNAGDRAARGRRRSAPGVHRKRAGRLARHRAPGRAARAATGQVVTATPSASWQARWVVRAIQVILRLLPWQERHRLARRARRLFEAPNPLTGCARAGCGSGESRRRNPAPRDRGVILYFDGGGYVGGSHQ
jgi:hypothetical protein